MHVDPDHGENVGHLKKIVQQGYLIVWLFETSKVLCLDKTQDESHLDSLDPVEHAVRESTFESLLPFIMQFMMESPTENTFFPLKREPMMPAFNPPISGLNNESSTYKVA